MFLLQTCRAGQIWINLILLGVSAWSTTGIHPASADEGMWLFNDLPAAKLQERYGFTPTEAWAEHIRLSSVRFNSGGSASFVSRHGLVITNHHVASDTLQKLSTAEDNYVRDGFLARSRDEEIAAPDLELNQLVSIEDVTDRVNSVVTGDMSASDAFKARRAAMATIEKASLDATKLRSDVVTLYGGAAYHLYRYRKFTDVRLVFAPETQAAFFGGDPDNFEFPRYCYDIALFRVYEDGKPAEIENFLRYSASGPKEGELVFVSGNPGRTQRLFTLDALKFLRDKYFPLRLQRLYRTEILLQQYGYNGEEQSRRARDELFGIQNSRKAYTGMLQGLQDPTFFANKAEQERKLRDTLRQDTKLRPFVEGWESIEDVIAKREKEYDKVASFSRSSRLYDIAETILLMSSEDQKPSEERLREFRDSARESLELDLFSPAPIYDDLEQVRLADALALLVEQRGGDDPLVAQVLDGKSPQERAAELVAGTKLKDIDTRRQLAKDAQAVAADQTDKMLQLARIMETEYRQLRDASDEIDEQERQAYAKITEAKVAVEGTSGYPDATFTLRLAFGTVNGYLENGQPIPAWTTIGGAYEHESAHNAQGDWKLPRSWHDHINDVNKTTPLNFVCTADIIGGNSGSPVVNREGEFVGIIFDGNIQSLTADFMYTDTVARAISVHSSGIREGLRTIYQAPELADELGR
ncbi:MAG: S46 family peptidase [Pirellulaceae bacterium]|nr:S46 family peptidase [Planctomycetales bacterium]